MTVLGSLAPRNERGHAMIVVSAAISLLIGAAGLAVDAGRFYQEQKRLQTAAAAAALAGASELWRNRLLDVIGSGRAGSAMNGFPHDENTSVEVHHPPITGEHRGNPRYVEAHVTRRTPMYFMQMLGRPELASSARAVAGPGADGRNCVYVLDPAAADAFTVSRSTFDASCGVMVNSANPNAVHTAAGARVRATDVAITGGYRAETRSLISASPTTDAAAQPDPLAYLEAPRVGNCDHSGWTRAAGAHTISPGVYCGGITLHGRARVNMTPGLYVIRGGGVKARSRAQLSGRGVTFYLTGDGQHRFAPIHFERGTQSRLSAPTSGAYAGILFFQDRSMNPEQTHRFASRGKSFLEGALYFPTQIVRLEGSTTQEARYTLIVSRLLQVDGGGILNVRNDYSRLPGGSPIKKLALLE